LDAASEKRLAQLELDKEKLLEQMAETQRLKRAGLRDWDRLDRESSICALKSELAEGHLQRMVDESLGGGILF
jgi:predicted alpha/beta hydrolase